MRGIGETNAKAEKMTTQEDYLQRLRDAYGVTENPRMREFIYLEIRKIMVQRGQWEKKSTDILNWKTSVLRLEQ